ncbi:hypothetical protein U9M48_029574 [Paspalum notatum var. saurae]|uniref:Uncharacterized protein n=1 Tax=Paspalum notatum var. saurae TaxID=547442 RepID=A0AAQ3X2A3_PASNO
MKPKATPSRLGTRVPRVTNHHGLLKVSPSSKLKNERGKEEKRCSEFSSQVLARSTQRFEDLEAHGGERCGGESPFSKYVLGCLEVEEAL